MAIDWGIIQAAGPVDIAGNFARGYQLADTIVSKIHAKNALGYLAQNPDDQNALAQLYQADPQMGAHFERRAEQRREAMQAEEAHRRRAELGGQFTTDPTGATNAALSEGDFDLVKVFHELGDADKKKTADFWGQAGAVAFKLRKMADPAERQAFWGQARPMLEAQGAPAEMLDQFDPTNDTQLDAAITTSQKIGDLIDQNKITWHQQGEQPSFATDSMGRPVGSQNPYRAGAPSPTTASAGPQEVATVLSSGGLPTHVVAGFLGNFHAEGGYGGAKGDGGSASGIAQWRGERAANFERVVGKAPNQASPAEQAQFVLWEMQNPEAAGMSEAERDSILRAPTAEAAAALIDQHYERSAGHHLAKRMAAAKGFAATMGAVHHVESKAEYDKLPSGTPFIAPDGSRRVKP